MSFNINWFDWERMRFRAKLVEQMRSLKHFLLFSPREQKKCILFSQTFFGSLRRFLHSLHSAAVVTGRYVFRSGCYVLRSATPEGTPASLRTPQPSLQTPRPFTPYAPLRSFRKVFRDPKSLREQAFFLFSRRKKKFQRTLIYSKEVS